MEVAVFELSGNLGEAIIRRIAPGNRMRFAYFSQSAAA